MEFILYFFTVASKTEQMKQQILFIVKAILTEVNRVARAFVYIMQPNHVHNACS